MDRREAIRKTALLMGGAVFGPTAMGLLNGCSVRPGVSWNPEYFSNTQARLVTVVADIILPADEQAPGAAELGVPAFIEEMLFLVHGDNSRKKFLEGLDVFNTTASGSSEAEFLDLNPEEQLLFSEEQNRKMVEWKGRDMPQELYFFRSMKELTLAGYFTTEVGATQVLRYEAVPGSYDGCVPFEEVGRTWAV